MQTNKMNSCQSVIAHIDLDCFYAQVEALRLGIDCRTQPYVLSQWGGLIAVNYPARAFGVTRFETLREALEKCPQLKYSHVATFEIGDPQYRYYPNPNKGTHKVSLDPYRQASRNIFHILNGITGVVVEKGGVDEAFLNVTEAAKHLEKELEQHTTPQLFDIVSQVTRLFPDRSSELMEFLKGEKISEVEDFSPAPTDDFLRLLYCGAIVVNQIRDQIRISLGYDCSAGIAHNRMLAKCISATYKPNQQTLLLPERTLGYLFDLKFSKLRMFGGKLGQTVMERFDSQTCGELWKFDRDSFRSQFDDVSRGVFIYRRVRGFDDQPVVPKSMPKTLLAEKVFSPPTNNLAELRKWYVVLAMELVDRLQVMGDEYNVTGHKLIVKLGQGGLSDGRDVGNRTLPLPTPTTADTIVAVAMQFAQQALTQKPQAKINVVSMTVTGFRKLDANGDVLDRKQQTLDTLFRKRIRQDDEDTDDDDVVIVAGPQDRKTEVIDVDAE